MWEESAVSHCEGPFSPAAPSKHCRLSLGGREVPPRGQNQLFRVLFQGLPASWGPLWAFPVTGLAVSHTEQPSSPSVGVLGVVGTGAGGQASARDQGGRVGTAHLGCRGLLWLEGKQLWVFCSHLERCLLVRPF